MVFPTLCGPEIGVASTKALTAQLTALASLVIAAGVARGTIDRAQEQELVRALVELPAAVSAALGTEDQIEKIAKGLSKAKDVLYLGRGQMFPVAMEGALKLKEISYIHAEGYPAGELKHGPIALVDEVMPVIVVAPSDELMEKTMSNMQEVAARGGQIILVTDAEGKAHIGHGVAETIVIPKVLELRRADPGADPGAAAGLSYGRRSWAPTSTSRATSRSRSRSSSWTRPGRRANSPVMTAALVLTPPDHPLVGRVTPPGSKSITNRALLLAALAKGTSRLTGALKSKDTSLMATALRQMGVVVDEPDATSFIVRSAGFLAPPVEPLFLGNAGTATRFLTAAAALVDGTVVVDGDDAMRKRPIGPLVTALNSLGIIANAPTGCPPVMIEGHGHFGSGRVEIDGGLSSQYVSALLMAAAFGEGAIDVALTGKDLDARGYVDLTVAAMTAFGGSVSPVDRTTWRVAPIEVSGDRFRHRARRLGGDLSLGSGRADRRSHRPRRADACLHSARCQGRRVHPHVPEDAGGDRRLADAGCRADTGSAGGVQRHAGALHRHRQSARQGMRSHHGALDRA